MKKLWKLFGLITVSIIITACGGGGGTQANTTPGNISGTVHVANVTVNLSDPLGLVISSAISDSSGNYVLQTQAGGDLTVTPVLTGYTFSPASATITFTGADYPRVDFAATPIAVGGVTFTATLGGFNSVANTHYANGAYIVGAQTIIAGSGYAWMDLSGSSALLSYNSTYNSISVDLGSYLYGTGSCGVSASFTVGLLTYPLCSSVGVTLDRVAGIVTFASTPLNYSAPTTVGRIPAGPSSLGITATGSLTFPPF